MSAQLTSHLRSGVQVVERLEPISVLSPRVVRILGMNPSGYTLGGTNTYLLGTGQSRILFDSGQGKAEYIENLQKAMQLVGCTKIHAIVISHWHADHLGGVPSVQHYLGGDVPVFKVVREREPGYRSSSETAATSWDKFEPLVDNQVLKAPGVTLRLLHTPGHANDHIVGVIEEENSMLTADNVLGTGTGVFRDLTEYIASLERMLAQNPGRLYPGHGPVIDNGQEKIKQYIEHRMLRVRQVEAVLKGDPTYAFCAEEIARKVYPSDLDQTLFPPAVYNTRVVLEHLIKIGLCSSAQCGGDRYVHRVESAKSSI